MIVCRSRRRRHNGRRKLIGSDNCSSWLCKKQQVRFVFRSVSFILLVLGYSAYSYYHNGRHITEHETTSTFEGSSRNLAVTSTPQLYGSTNTTRSNNGTNVDDLNSCDSASSSLKVDPPWKLTFYVLGVVYMFLALAVAVDEFFVPALEEMSSNRHLGLSMDVAGATLMAAGGSAPELFTAFFGTFSRSEVGFGTVVGSAVFNVLFVIGMCSLLSKEILSLTWWPLLRDCSYYVLSLTVLAIFVGVYSKKRIYVQEAAILLVMYLGYVLLMKYNRAIYFKLTGKHLAYDDEDDEDDDDDDDQDDEHRGSDLELAASLRRTTSFRWGGSFRVGVLQLLRDTTSGTTPANVVEKGGEGLVSSIAGNVHDTWQTVDKDRDGTIRRDELVTLFRNLDCPLMTAEQVDDVLRQLDDNDDGKIDKKEFTTWYLRSEDRIKNRIKEVFNEYDIDDSGTIDRNELTSMFRELEPQVTERTIHTSLFNEMYQEGNTEEITLKEFTDWYLDIVMNIREAKNNCHDNDTPNNADNEGVFANLKPPPFTSTDDDGNTTYNLVPILTYVVLFPLVLTLTITVPDVRRAPFRTGSWCYVAFLFSIAWIGVYSNYMVRWTQVIGHTVGVPDVVMGLTFLAAGTSVPDLLSSVSVARRGEGDMAVSSSIGSNIFDILVGLPLPWLLYDLIESPPNGASGPTYVSIGSDGVLNSVIILLVMVVAIIVTIHFSGWKLTKNVGIIMFVLYFAFLAQSVWSELPFENMDC